MKFSTVGPFFLIYLLFIGINYVKNRTHLPPIKISKQQDAVNIDDQVFFFFNLGNKRLLSDIFWVQTLIESDYDHYKSRDLNSWMYLRFRTITRLDPLFREAYLYGGRYLSVVKDDLLGASEIYDEGIKHYPDDYDLNFNAGIHFYTEMDEQQKAVGLLSKIMYHDRAPTYLPSLIARLKVETGQKEGALLLLNEALFRTEKNTPIYERMKKNINQLQTEIDLNCLNSGKKDCRKVDFLGNRYLWSNSQRKWIAKKKLKKFKLFKKERRPQ